MGFFFKVNKLNLTLICFTPRFTNHKLSGQTLWGPDTQKNKIKIFTTKGKHGETRDEAEKV